MASTLRFTYSRLGPSSYNIGRAVQKCFQGVRGKDDPILVVRSVEMTAKAGPKLVVDIQEQRRTDLQNSDNYPSRFQFVGKLSGLSISALFRFLTVGPA